MLQVLKKQEKPVGGGDPQGWGGVGGGYKGVRASLKAGRKENSAKKYLNNQRKGSEKKNDMS